MPTKLLICDDDEGILDLLEMVLVDEGYAVIPELNSMNASAIIQKERPDLVILDLWMPVLSGDQVLKTIRKNPAVNNLPVIIISASHDGKQIALDAGADAFIAKPFDIDDLVKTVKDVMKGQNPKLN